ncbi:MAG: hypothetical protein QOI61_2019 [Actinomycetota bacterium]|jgi:hypothetical protein
MTNDEAFPPPADQNDNTSSTVDDIKETAPQRAPTKTPLWEAIHADRYQRQDMIRTIEARHGHQLICFVSGDDCLIDRADAVPFVDLLHNVDPSRPLDLLLHTGGGDIDAAEKLITMVRTHLGKSRLRIVVPDFAKSAGTLMVLGADAVVMSDTSELGAIDPQVFIPDGNGHHAARPIQSYLDAYEKHTAALKKEPGNVAAQIMLGQLDPAMIERFYKVKERARKFAENQLKQGMFFHTNGNWSRTVSELLDTTRWQSHSQMISWQDAKDEKTLGLTVEYLKPSCDEWQEYWVLYCHQRLAIGDRQKLFESNFVCLKIDSPI